MNDYDPSLVSEPPGSGGRLDFGAMLRDRIARQQKVSSNPLYRFGSALAGQDPDAGLSPLMQMLMQQEEMGLRREGLDVQRGNLDVSRGQLDIQREQETRLKQTTDAQIAQIRMQMAGGMVDLIKKIQPFVGSMPPEAIETISQFGARLGQFSAKGTGEEGFMTPEFFKHVLTQPDAVDTYLGNAKHITPAEKQVLQMEAREKGVAAMLESLKKLGDQKREAALGSAKSKIQKLPRGAQPRQVWDAFREAGLDDLELESAWSALADPKNDAYLASLNILPPSVGAEATKAAATERAKLGVKEASPSGQADLAKTVAETGLAGARTRQTEQDIQTGKVVAGQPGAPIIQVKGDKATTLVQGEKKPADTRIREKAAASRNLIKTLKEVQDQIDKEGPERFFSMATQAGAASKRAGEQAGVGKSDAGYEAFWAKMDELRAEIVRQKDSGNLSRSDIDFFLANWPERGVAPTAAVSKLKSISQRSKSRLASLEDEFPDIAQEAPNPGPAWKPVK